MGRYEKVKKLVRSDKWKKVGGIDSLMNQLQKADVLNRNTKYSSEVWSQLAIDLFNDDTPKKRHWLWMIWMKKQKDLRERVHLAIEEGVGLGSPQNGTEEMEQGYQGKIIKSQY